MTPKAETKKYSRRTTEQQIADLQAKIDAVKSRAARKEAVAGVKADPAGLAFLVAVKAADRAIRVAGEQKNDPMVRVLEAARAPLAGHLVEMGLRLPDPKARKGRKRKAVVAAS